MKIKLKLLLIVVCLFFKVEAIAQLKFGLELNGYTSTLRNISQDTMVTFGLSGAKVYSSPTYGIAPSFLLRKEIGNKFSLETGLGYWSSKSKVHLNIYSQFFSHEFDTTLNISLKYIQIPVSVFYSFSLKKTIKLNFSGGLKTRILIAHKDNYEDIIFEKVGMVGNRYNRIVIVPTFGIALEKELPKGQTYELGFFSNFNLNSLVNNEHIWGFFNNLYPAKNYELGFSIKFFL
jgi:hypothetical protein